MAIGWWLRSVFWLRNSRQIEGSSPCRRRVELTEKCRRMIGLREERCVWR